MKIGVVNMNNREISSHWKNFFSKYKINPIILHYSEPDLVKKIETSFIKCWILTGSDEHIGEPNYPQVPSTLFTLKKRFLCICYSHQLFCYYLGFEVNYLPEKRDGLYPIKWNSHDIFSFEKQYYFLHSMFVKYKEQKHLNFMAIENDMVVAIKYKNVTGIQFHPEKHESTYLTLYRWILKNI